MSSSNSRSVRFGFTLLEMIIALAVFSIGVFAVLRLLMTNMATVEKIQTRTVATFLAKEGLELAYARRNVHLDQGLPWNCGAELSKMSVLDASVQTSFSLSNDTDGCPWFRGSGGRNKVFFALVGSGIREYPLVSSTTSSLSSLSSSAQDFSGLFAQSSLSLFSGTSTALFARYLEFTGVIMSGNILPLEKIAKVSSHVLYKQGNQTGELILESFIGGQ